MNNVIGLDGCPRADAMLKQVDPYGIAHGNGDGTLSGPAPASTSTQAGQVLAIVAAALAAGAAVAMVFGATGHRSGGRRSLNVEPAENPRKTRRSDAEVEDLAEQVIREAGQAGGIDEVRAIAKKGWPSHSGNFTQRERAAIKRQAKRELRR
jgi:hypothetical protein